jgi:hypothetical protein
MSSYRNLRIKTILVPEFDDDGKETGREITLEVVETLIMRNVTQVFDGGTVEGETLFFVCFEKEEGRPQKLHIINSESELIIVKRYEHENYAIGNQGKRNQKRKTEGRTDNNS